MSSAHEVPWESIEEALRSVLDRPSAERERAIDAACGENEALRREVRALLAAEEASGSFMASPVFDERPLIPARASAAERAPVGSDALPDPPLTVPGYRLIGHLGTGGMGAVYLAERADGHFEHRVAIKALRGDVLDEPVARRFVQERQILAWLRHPNIAMLLDGGISSEGIPYFVMEYVDGRPIGEACDALRLAVVDRVRVFLAACRGVGHAHRNQIVHRDLKPSNILVTASGETKLLDFGIAKLLKRDPRAAVAELPLTRTSQVMLTPLYAAPEQIRGGVIGPQADVFSLGVVLYELLTGRHPFAVDAWSLGEAERAILDGRASPPSEVVTRAQDVRGPDGRRARVLPVLVGRARSVTPAELCRGLRGNLDAILMKSLANAPEERYPHADALAQDLERHLTGRAVSAPQRSRIQQVRSWWRNQRTRGRLEESAWSVREAGRQARRADAMMSFLARMFELASPTSAGRATITAREMLDWAAEHVDEQLGDEPDARADILATLGRILHEMGDDARAAEILTRALEAQRGLHGNDDPRLIPTLRYLATAHQDLADYAPAEAHFREALAIARAAFGDRHLEVSSRLNDLAILMDRVGELTESRSLYEASLTIKRENLEADDPQVVTNVNNLAVLLQRMGYSRESEHLLAQVLDARRRAFGDESIYVANALNNLMVAHRRRGDHATAEPLAREAFELRKRLLGPEHPDVALSLYNLACVLRDLGRYEDAEPMMAEAISLAERTRGEKHPDVAGMLSGFATLRRSQKRLDAAETISREALRRIEDRLSTRNPQLANVQLELATNLLEQERAAEAEPLLREVLETRRLRLGLENPLTAEASLALARGQLALGQRDEAAERLAAALPLLERAFGAVHPEVRRAKHALETLG